MTNIGLKMVIVINIYNILALSVNYSHINTSWEKNYLRAGCNLNEVTGTSWSYH